MHAHLAALPSLARQPGMASLRRLAMHAPWATPTVQVPPTRGTRLPTVARYVVDVMPKHEILDPQGKAVLGALPRLGFDGVVDVRQGKRFEVEVSGDPSDETLAEVRKMAETLLSNPVIEDYEVRVHQR